MEERMPGKAGHDVTNLGPNFSWSCFRVTEVKVFLEFWGHFDSSVWSWAAYGGTPWGSFSTPQLVRLPKFDSETFLRVSLSWGRFVCPLGRCVVDWPVWPLPFAQMGRQAWVKDEPNQALGWHCHMWFGAQQEPLWHLELHSPVSFLRSRRSGQKKT